MKLHTVFISYNRLELTQQAIASYEETVTVPHTVCVVDNGSTDGAAQWIEEQALVKRFDAILLPENKYPGYACNRGWEQAPLDATVLQRCDNDFGFLPGWCEHIEMMLNTKKIGQIGLRTSKEERFARWNVGGNCVIRRELWDAGLRYDERPWGEYPYRCTEDSLFSPAVKEMGWLWRRVGKPCVVSLASGDLTDPYYQESYGIRGIIEV